jgi:hypothetical protein
MYNVTHSVDDHTLVVDLTRRLPDVTSIEALEEDLDAFGRFAILQSGILWFGDIHSSFPSTIQVGFFWALGENRLYISPTGCTLDWEDYISAKTVHFLADKLALRRFYRDYTVVL